ncbi:MAG TPA: toprim domain-containing protein [Allosphingosinicella sp.]|nr:toprim domain-containing protein [Allosphingosinicella sp.]
MLHLDGRPAGAFGNYRLGARQLWKSGSAPDLSPSELRAQREEWRRKAEERDRAKVEAEEGAAREAEAMWTAAGEASPSHPYLVRKALDAEGLRQAGDTLLAPMLDIRGRLWNLQRIRPDGVKLFLKDARTKGLFCLIGGGGSRCCLGEGVGTMKAVRMATGFPVAAAFSGENLEPVARSMRRRWPGLGLIICGDNDAHLVERPNIGRNLGLEYAAAAAAAVRGLVAKPPPGDFADLAQAAGLDAVRVAIEEAV